MTIRHFQNRRAIGWLAILAIDLGGARPLLAGLADTDRIAHGDAGLDHQIEFPLAGLHHNGPGGVFPVEIDHAGGGLSGAGGQDGSNACGGNGACNLRRH
jgi:hypothetical protein